MISSQCLLAQNFTNRAAELGIEVEHSLGDIEGDFTWGTGAVWIHYDLDGDLDLYVGNRGVDNQFFENQTIEGNDFFIDITDEVNLACVATDCAGMSVADFNNDGYPDIYVGTHQADYLFQNVNGESFLDVSGLLNNISGSTTRGSSITWFDFDNDGYLDLYLSNHVPSNYHYGVVDTNDYLMHNEVGLGFTDASFLLSDFGSLHGSSYISGWTDIDGDNDFDLIVTNDCTHQWPVEQIVYENLGPSGSTWDTWQFDTIQLEVGLNDCASAMGLAIADIDHDSDMDLAYSNISKIRLWENDNGVFNNIAVSAGVGIQQNGNYSWGINFGDFDNDTWQDLIVVSGYLGYGETLNNLGTTHPNYYFGNNGDNTFDDLGATHNFSDSTRGRTSIIADYDNDGDLDVFIVNYDSLSQFKQNNLSNGNHYLKIDLVGVISNRDGIGAKIEIETPDGVHQYAETRSGSSLGGGDSPYTHFGLGSNDSIVSIRVNWPSGIEQVIENIVADTFIVIVEEELLPVEGISLNAKQEGNGILLSWEFQLLSDEISIERRNHWGEFVEIAIVPAEDLFRVRFFLDESPQAGRNYYRLRSGTVYSNVVAVLMDNKAFRIHPSLLIDSKLSISGPFLPGTEVYLYNVDGKTLWSHFFAARMSAYEIDVPNIVAGNYFIVVVTGESFEFLRFTKI